MAYLTFRWSTEWSPIQGCTAQLVTFASPIRLLSATLWEASHIVKDQKGCSSSSPRSLGACSRPVLIWFLFGAECSCHVKLTVLSAFCWESFIFTIALYIQCIFTRRPLKSLEPIAQSLYSRGGDILARDGFALICSREWLRVPQSQVKRWLCL